MSEPRIQKQPEPILPAPGETRRGEDEYGPIFFTTCKTCGHQIVSRMPGAARCACGALAELKS